MGEQVASHTEQVASHSFVRMSGIVEKKIEDQLRYQE